MKSRKLTFVILGLGLLALALVLWALFLGAQSGSSFPPAFRAKLWKEYLTFNAGSLMRPTKLPTDPLTEVTFTRQHDGSIAARFWAEYDRHKLNNERFSPIGTSYAGSTLMPAYAVFVERTGPFPVGRTGVYEVSESGIESARAGSLARSLLKSKDTSPVSGWTMDCAYLAIQAESLVDAASHSRLEQVAPVTEADRRDMAKTLNLAAEEVQRAGNNKRAAEFKRVVEMLLH